MGLPNELIEIYIMFFFTNRYGDFMVTGDLIGLKLVPVIFSLLVPYPVQIQWCSLQASADGINPSFQKLSAPCFTWFWGTRFTQAG